MEENTYISTQSIETWPELALKYRMFALFQLKKYIGDATGNAAYKVIKYGRAMVS